MDLSIRVILGLIVPVSHHLLHWWLHKRKTKMDDCIDEGRKYDVFLVYPSKDSANAEKVEEILKQNGQRVCIHERDFLPGALIMDNISPAITESRKYVIIYDSNCTGVYKFEIHRCLLNCVITGKERAIILLVSPEDTDVPLELKAYQCIVQQGHWQKQLIQAVKEPIVFKRSVNFSNNYVVISVSHLDSEFRNSQTIDALNYLRQRVNKLQEIEVSKAVDEAKRNADSLRYRDAEGTSSISSIEAMEKMFNIMEAQPTVVILWICKKFQCDQTSQGFLQSLLLSLMDRPECPVIISVQPKGSQPIGLLKDISYLPFESLVAEGTRHDPDECNKRFMEHISKACKANHFITYQGLTEGTGNSMKSFDARSGRKVFRVSEVDGKFQDEMSPRYLGISFTGDGHLVLLDADNSCLKKMTILGFPIKKMPFEEMPNRLSRVDDDHVALIFWDTYKILTINTAKMEIEGIREIEKQGVKATLKGITALDKDTMVVTSSGQKCSLNIGLVQKTNIQQSEIVEDLDGNKFSMPRRLTKLDQRTIAIAD
ncbi:uncharacterized protein [Argopecten irradians]|uniref:uncharacterized protein n=1 Tax=Argopecten irradians TaxID=31199 RepID=UPI0037249F40